MIAQSVPLIDVAILSTVGPSSVVHLKEIPARLRRSTIGLNGLSGSSGIDAEYTDFVRMPTGVIEGLYGHPAFRLDVSAPLATGLSWQFGVLIAHVLARAGRLHLPMAAGGDSASPGPLLLLTGTVRCIDLAVGEVGDLEMKARNAIPLITAARAAGREVLFGLPVGNLADITPRTRSEIEALGAGIAGFADVRALCDRLGVQLPAPATVAPGAGARGWTGNPFMGLDPFRTSHRAVFFGRARAREEVLERLRTGAAQGLPFVMVHGRSGAGKSSLVAAGVVGDVVTHASEGGVWLPLVLRLGAAGESALAMLRGGLLRLLPGTDAALLAQDPAAAIRAALDSGATETGTQDTGARGKRSVLLVLDQFEQALAGDSDPDLAAFAQAVVALVRSGRVWTVATLRSDQIDALDRLPAIAALARDARLYRLDPPTLYELTEIIVQPAALAGLRFAAGPQGESLPETLAEIALRSPDSLPLLQMILARLADLADAGGTIPFAAYARLGGFETATGRAAEEIAERLFAGGLAEREFDRLLGALVRIDPGSGRGLARAIPLPVQGAPGMGQAAAALVDGRILSTDGDAARSLRLAHESLITHWPRLAALVATLRTDLIARDRIEDAATAWDSAGRSADDLIGSDTRLAGAEDLTARAMIPLSGVSLDYLTASRVAQDRKRATLEDADRRKTRSARRLAAVFAVIGLLGLGLAGYAWFQARAAEQANATAQRETERAEENAEEARRNLERAVAATQEAEANASIAAENAERARRNQEFAEAATDEAEGSRAEAVAARSEAEANAALATRREAEAESALRAATAAADRLLVDLVLEFGNRGLPSTLTRGILDEIDRLHSDLTELSADDPALLVSRARALRELAKLLNIQGETAGAAERQEQAIALLRRLVAAYPENPDYMVLLSIALSDYGVFRVEIQDIAGGNELILEGGSIASQVFEMASADGRPIEDPAYLIPSQKVAYGLARVSMAYQHYPEAESALVSAREFTGYLLLLEPDNTTYQSDLAAILDGLGFVAERTGNLESAQRHLEEASDIIGRLSLADPDNTALIQSQAGLLGRLAGLSRLANDPANAEAHFTRALELIAELAARDPANADRQEQLADGHFGLADHFVARNMSDDGAEHFRAALEIYRWLDLLEPGRQRILTKLANALQRLGDLDLAAGRLDDAFARFLEGLDIWRALAAVDPANEYYGQSLVTGLFATAYVQGNLGRTGEAISRLQEAETLSVAWLARRPISAWQDRRDYARGQIAMLEGRAEPPADQFVSGITTPLPGRVELIREMGRVMGLDWPALADGDPGTAIVDLLSDPPGSGLDGSGPGGEVPPDGAGPIAPPDIADTPPAP